MPEMQMSDYKVNYTNHSTYTDGLNKIRKQGSPARIFTNVSLERLILPVEEEYKYCASCRRYTALENRHCQQCGICPSKNGSTYKHCQLCGICVKPSYVHCRNCRRCTQVEGHNCTEYQTKQRCWICRQSGHIEKNCATWQNIRNKMILLNYNSRETEKAIVCYICDQKGHNELKCKERIKYFEETSFCGEVQLKLKL
ncbi:rRNA N6-adenosine-methyltransferase ZCCHC4-like [Teleopsis dalmanni]|uniref:rRNA N6-adenosine-methyltransferase ZCCHC4-like n=1 Tax=Teleopsis dalmanni TaxID=139649 RepID=UPI0018CD2509|nr:rRNA N6-adenosine-methyltransferase ZCCHC4-like [Teleopsis dalmanni]